ncbi:hypothetical protein BHM03_00036562 [Ensete ventricosum]|nr:hypothetical protein BHM03_00036562 [Ensete ventricosum]
MMRETGVKRNPWIREGVRVKEIGEKSDQNPAFIGGRDLVLCARSRRAPSLNAGKRTGSIGRGRRLTGPLQPDRLNPIWVEVKSFFPFA